MSVLLSQGRSSKLAKRDQDLVNRFAYYAQQIADSNTQLANAKLQSEASHAQASFGNSQYHYLHLTRDSYQHQSLLDRATLMQVAQMYLKPTSSNLIQKGNCEKVKREHLSQEGSLGFQRVELLVVEERKKEDYWEKGFDKKQQSAITMGSIAELSELRNYSIYILHVADQTQTKSIWNYFVEKIWLQADLFSKQGHSLPIEYEAIISFPKQTWLQENVMKWLRASQNNKQTEQLLQASKHRLNLFESGLAKALAKASQNQLKYSLNCHPEFKREDKLPAEHYKTFQRIKAQTYAYFSSINRNRKLNRYFLDNLVCRFMVNKKYDEREALEALRKYLDWEKMMRSKYTLQSFKRYQEMDIFRYIGKDYQGRPIIYFRSDRYLPQNIPQEQEYIDYNAYMLQIYLQDQMEGYVDEYSILGDYRGFCTDNFKYSIAKGFSEVSNLYFPERQYKLILFGINSFGEWIYKIIRPILPEFILQKISIFGSEPEDLQKELKDFMDISQLPPCLTLKDSQTSSSKTKDAQTLSSKANSKKRHN